MQRRNLLGLAEDRVLVEQVRLLLSNVRSQLIPTSLLAILLLWALSNDGNALVMRGWCATVIASKLSLAVYARSILASDIARVGVRKQVGILIVLNMVDAAAWAGLAWFTLDTASPSSSVLVLACLAGIAGGAVALLAPVLPICLAFVVVEFAVLASKLWHLGDSSYGVLGVASLFYLAALAGQARNSAAAARAAIELRFENVELVKEAHKARLEAEEANQAKSKFLAAASHDLRQPIHAQGLFLEVLSQSGLTAKQSSVLENVRAASVASAEMLNTLLDFSRIEAGVVEAQIRPFHLQPLMNKLDNELAPQANAKGLVFRSRETHCAVESDPALLELILRNLVTNAIRYTGHGGVLVACRARGGQTLLEVWDTGVGIELSQQQEIFREFHQLGNPERDRNKGLGLGLAIAQGLALRLGHGLSLASTPGRGSVFRLTLPTAQCAVVTDPLEPTQSQTRVINARVLVLDDDEAVREGMAQLLHEWGCSCVAVETIDGALISARAYRPDVVISDYRLREDRTGTQAITALRAEFGADLPALLITGDTAPLRLREALASGVPLLHKPVSPALLYRRLTSVLDGRAVRPLDSPKQIL